jgi:hypothetical protein
MKSEPMTRFLCFALLLTLADSARSGTLYATDFSEFPVGENLWAGTEGWSSTDVISGAQGIITNPVADLPIEKAGYLGFEKPESRFTSVFRSFNHDPVASGLPIIHFESLLGVQDSTNGFRDLFRVTFYNSSGDFLAGLIFNNNTGFILRDDGVTVHSTGVRFLVGEPLIGLAALQVLEARIDLISNTWSTKIDGIPLFDDVPFTATSGPLILGPVAAEWEVVESSTEDAGNNWLLVTDWLVGALPAEPFEMISFGRSGSISTLTWPGHSGFLYQVLHSVDLVDWEENLPNSNFSPSTDGVLSFTDDNPVQPTARFYKVRRDFIR